MNATPDLATDAPISRRDARRARHRETVAAVAAKEMADTRYDRFRTRRARRLLVVVYALLTISISVAWAVGQIGAWALVGLPAWVAVYYLLRRSIRNMADLPDDTLDERQIAVRDRTYLNAYRIFAGLMLPVLFGFVVAVDRRTLTYEDMSAVMWFAVGSSIGLPAAVLAWTTDDA